MKKLINKIKTLKEPNLEKLLKKQIKLCKKYDNYTCGIYYARLSHYHKIKGLLDNNPVSKTCQTYHDCIVFNNGSEILLLPMVASKVKSHKRVNSAIIDSNISQPFIEQVIKPMIIPMYNKKNDKTDKRVDICKIY